VSCRQFVPSLPTTHRSSPLAALGRAAKMSWVPS